MTIFRTAQLLTAAISVGAMSGGQSNRWPLDPIKNPPAESETNWDYNVESWTEGWKTEATSVAFAALQKDAAKRHKKVSLSDYETAAIDRGKVIHVHFLKRVLDSRAPVQKGSGRVRMGGGVIVILDKKLMKAKYILASG